jgi:hypothetical protein
VEQSTIHTMRTIARSWPALLSVFMAFAMAFAHLSASACDLSCSLDLKSSDCHAAVPAATDNHRMMSASSDMDMSSEMGTSPRGTQDKAGSNHAVNAGTRHFMPAKTDLVRVSLPGTGKSELGSSATFDPPNSLSPCSHKTCSHASASASPPKAGQAHPVYLRSGAVDVLYPTNLPSGGYRTVSGTPSPINLPIDLLPILRI